MNPQVERWKKEFGLKGDVYIYKHNIESLESHRKLFPNSIAATIEEAELERALFEKAELQKRIEATKAIPIEEPTEQPKKKKGRKK
jgi:hypothetical protein